MSKMVDWLKSLVGIKPPKKAKRKYTRKPKPTTAPTPAPTPAPFSATATSADPGQTFHP